jgi:hypothetical protein
MLIYRRLIFCILILITLTRISAQEFVYKAEFFGFFDNREYFNPFVNDQTIFGSRISGELGYSFNPNSRIMAGADYLYEFGSKGEWIAPDLIAYYQGKHRKFEISLGAFPRLNKVVMPMAMLSDTIGYYRPVMEGILIEYHSGGFRHNIWIDWTAKQSLQKRETFLLGFSGFLKKGMFIYQHHFVMTHLAHSLKSNVVEHIRDNGAYSILPGIDLSGFLHLDSLTFNMGILGSYDRVRGTYVQYPVGLFSEIEAQYKGFGLHGTFYTGEEQVITSGDGFYQSDLYARADAFYQVANTNLNGRLQLSLHYVPGIIDLSMSLVVRASIDGPFKRYQSR